MKIKEIKYHYQVKGWGGADLYHTGSLIIALQVLTCTLEIGTEAETHKIECLYFSRVYTNEKNFERERRTHTWQNTQKLNA